MKTGCWLWIPAAALLLAGANAGWGAAPMDRYNVVWDSPSTNQHGSVPLGNGDVAANAWVSPEGEVHVYLSKTDAWDDNARLVKVGKVRVRLEPNPLARSTRFRQTLDLQTGTLEAELGEGAARTRVRVWVDAHHPVVQVDVQSATPLEATACADVWRTNRVELAELECSDVLLDPKLPSKKQSPTIVEPDTILANLPGRIGWYHHNGKSVGFQIQREIQGLTDFAQADPILHRTFGAVVAARDGQRLDDLRLRSPAAKSHRFSVFVLTRQPATGEQWLQDVNALIDTVEKRSFSARRRAHEQWWGEFWNRSWIRATLAKNATPTAASWVPTNTHPVRLGSDQAGGNRLAGELGRVRVFDRPLTDAQVAELAKVGPEQDGPALPGLIYAGRHSAPKALSDSSAWAFPSGLTLEVWVKPEALAESGARLVDKISAGGSDGFLLDTYPGNSLRLICGEHRLQQANALPAGRWTHVTAVADPKAGGCRLYVDGRLTARDGGASVEDEAAYVSQMYHLQRYITACAGRGAFPIKFNGSLFTVPPGPTERDPDYRRWGPGYWWQNTRLPYLSLCASGDFDLQRPLFRMYVDELLPLAKYRTQHYLGHAGAFYPECIMFWGTVFSETYGWTPWAQRADKLQDSGYHKWEWVGGLELAWMSLDYYDHTQDREFLGQTALPFTKEVLTFFDRHYPTNAQGKLVMYPSQALETWWRCTNATPELAGCIALCDRLLALPTERLPQSDRAFYQELRAKLPPIPTREVNGRRALAPAEFFAERSNCENPELYPVFPFRLFAFNRPNADWALAALEHRWDRGHFGWRQDDLFMAYLGQAEETRQAVVSRARSHDPQERFPAFWGPNYDWTPDQDHGGVLMRTLQTMALQTDGREIFLLPAWPKSWNVEFRLHAPERTVVEGVYRDGAWRSLRVTPSSRQADVKRMR